MSYSYERSRSHRYGASGRRTAFGYWVPLAITVTAATVGLAAWIWSERRDDDDDDDDDNHDEQRTDKPPHYGDLGPGEASFATGAEFDQGPPMPPRPSGDNRDHGEEDVSVLSRMSGALRRTPSPQQFFDSARTRVVAGMAAAGAVVGGALSSIREEDNRGDWDYGYEETSAWQEEAERQHNNIDLRGGSDIHSHLGAPPSSRQASHPSLRSGLYSRKKSVAIVISAQPGKGFRPESRDYEEVHTSILSHLPEFIDLHTTRVFILIYAPDLKQHPLTASSPTKPEGSVTSSFSNILTEEARTPGSELDRPLQPIEPNPLPDAPPSASPLFKALYNQAQILVEKETMVMPFTTRDGYTHMLRHLNPDIAYIHESLAGESGESILHVSNWVRQVLVVVGDEAGLGGLIDSDDERGGSGKKPEKWWQRDNRVGFGKGVEIVDGMRVGEDWRRRVGGRD
ncbi:MAG: hypothetical protein M1834_000176 [Cirrosporium novae-zelandiae]|nr:MAG: hypothetical protein M1834_000176 [Cirrosporium novae-zelandiae]